MSCNSNSKKSKLAAVKCGIARAASSTAYVTGVGGGFMVGAAIGSFAPGPGTIIGGVLGGAGAATLIKRNRRVKLEKKRDKKWRKSGAGKQALLARTEALDKASRKFNKQNARAKAIKKEAKTAFKLARVKGVADIKADKDAYKAIRNDALKSQALGLAGTVAMTAGSVYLSNSAYGVTTSKREMAISSAAAAAGKTPAAVAGYNKDLDDRVIGAWLQTPKGKKALGEYEAALDKAVKIQRKATQTYKRKTTAAEQQFVAQRKQFFIKQGWDEGN